MIFDNYIELVEHIYTHKLGKAFFKDNPEYAETLIEESMEADGITREQVLAKWEYFAEQEIMDNLTEEFYEWWEENEAPFSHHRVA